ncbi:flagellin [Clostridium estertheticum]|uniref:flagellin n=1 Tax=Clostridium estertheticum TaxID=238834 RepID=UPI001C0DE5A3|nr:flagellin [Clostridium estertheticum]MBU3074877.1 hypothetical protein [Clostridium estertheticum]MBU3165092.1 hypothetical protein [Clostridium estertheticum]MBU3173607.1 hypothetical protein [Clostridium estertheticum]
MIIKHNLSGMVVSNHLNSNTKLRAGSMKKLASGYRINNAADDAAGISISEKMRGQIRGLSRAAQNVQDGISYVQVADGALGDVTELLQRMRVLAVQAGNDTNTEDDRENSDNEIQQLKEGIDRVFEETEFNNIKIWDTNTNNKVQIGTEQKQAVDIESSFQTFEITDTNKGVVPYSGYKINVMGTDLTDINNYGITIGWTGYNGNNYSTDIIGWDKLSASNVSFNISDYLDVITYPELEGVSFDVSYNVTESAQVEDIAKALNGVIIASSPNTSQSISNTQEDSNINSKVSINYMAQLASGRLMNSYDTNFIEANIPGPGGLTSNVITPDYNADPIDSSSLGFSFTMPIIGTVTGSCSSVYYYSNDTSAETEGKWWDYTTIGDYKYKNTLTYTPAIGGTGLNSILSCVSRDDGYSITKDADSSGYIILGVNLTSNGQYAYGGKTSNDVGSITLMINVSNNDTQEDLLNKIKSNFNGVSKVDIFAGSVSDGSPSYAYDYAYTDAAKTSIIDVPIYKATHDVAIQSGANSYQIIDIVYDSLRTTNLGIINTNVLTSEDASSAISEIDNGLNIVNEQRSLFGAYENRMNHAYSNNMSAAENHQNSESRIRDLDIADETIKYSKYDILEQAALSLLSQANQSSQKVLELLK